MSSRWATRPILAANPDFYLGAPRRFPASNVSFRRRHDDPHAVAAQRRSRPDRASRGRAGRHARRRTRASPFTKRFPSRTNICSFAVQRSRSTIERIRLAACHSIDRQQVLDLLGVSGTASRRRISRRSNSAMHGRRRTIRNSTPTRRRRCSPRPDSRRVRAFPSSPITPRSASIRRPRNIRS